MKTAIRSTLVAGAVFGCMLLADSAWTHTTAQAAAKQITIQVNGEDFQFTNDIFPIIDEAQNMLVPLRPVAEQLGYDLNWQADGTGVQTIEMSNGTNTIRLKSNSSKAEVNGNTASMNSAPISYKDNTYVPFRFLLDQLQLSFTWDAEQMKDIPRINRSRGEIQTASAYLAENKAAAILNTAISYLGVPYIWGGTSPRGFDCSGFVSYVFRSHGIELPRTSGAMYNSLGAKVTRLQPGDLVFFAANGKTISHVGIYIGDNKYINATSGSAGSVAITSLSSAWSIRTYIGAKRVL
ncbi:NlpC/P60 family protein [Paenibacillus popilliae]|uniref:Hydrolase n=1 Tax=Paenibacillus popilliae ATCC 14706 TaxID=1212764 RepID=M9M8F8_PAEPP|nr:NlpC/P60 family protein [Paenibacillus popilliae]GAC44223.1 hydrolase [Paenibacillus popilliae ATCC 14706]